MAVVEFVEDFSPGKPRLQVVFCGDTSLLSAREIFHGADLLWPFVMGFLVWCFEIFPLLTPSLSKQEQ